MPQSPKLFVLWDGDLTSYAASFGKGAASGAEALAHALAASPAWASMPSAVLIAREAPRPAVAVLGRFDDAAEGRLHALRVQLGAALERLRYVSYAQAEEDCEALARRLIERFGRGEVRRFRFTGIPRGGLVVLGMLSYALDLEHAQLTPPHPPRAPLVVVDDCALTGSRFGRFLKQCESRRVVFAPLYAHPGLRASVESEPRVMACLSAQDLHDHGPERLGSRYAAWKKRWAERADGPRYWIGQPDHVCFPWNEPDMGVWNPSANAAEQGWRVVPPAHCLKNRPAADGGPSAPVQVQPRSRGPLAPAAEVFFGTFEGQLVVAHAGEKTSFRLTGAAAGMWRALVEHAAVEEALAALQGAYDADAVTLEADLRAFAKDLRAHDLLEEKRHAATSTA